MPNNPNFSSHVGAYIDPALKERAARLTRSSRRITMSRIIEECLAGYLPTIERRVERSKARKAVA